MIKWTQENIYKIYNIYDKYSDVLNQRYGYRAPDNKYNFLLDCQNEAANQMRFSIDDYIDELSNRLKDSDEFQRIKAECERPHIYEEVEYTSRGPIIRYKPADKYVELAKQRVQKILDDTL